MKTIRLTVNREPREATVAARTQLAELLRDHLHLTGTHLGCEHGVCGACTVLVNGRPIRSCITWAHACEGADVVTVEGLRDDPVGEALRDAFSGHHALQCGFCTPGMLITAWDVVTRLAPVDDAAIRRELNGNLCRCTGYMGIVAAVRTVARQRRNGGPEDGNDRAPSHGANPTCRRQRRGDGPADWNGRAGARELPGAPAAPFEPSGTDAIGAGEATDRGLAAPDTATSASSEADTARPAPADAVGARETTARDFTAPRATAVPESAAPPAAPFEPFEVDPAHLPAAAPPASGAERAATRTDGWTRLERAFTVEQPVDALWTLFEDLPRVARCIPGVSVESAGADRFTGRAAIRFGPIAAAFDGEGTREADAERRTGAISGRGTDARGHATLEAELRYAMSGEDAPPRPRTRVDLAIRFRIQGGLAQFNRSDLVESFADAVLADFVRNCERMLAGEEVRSGGSASGLALLWRMIKTRLGL